jgi:hypothetical protein
MRDYELYSPERRGWCVPATLQTGLKFREIEISQEEISKYFPKVEGGLDLNEESLRAFFNEFGLLRPDEKIRR